MDMGTNGYSLGPTISALLYLVTKVLIIVLAVVVVLGVVVWIRDNLLKNDSSRIVQNIKSDPLLKAISVITLAVIGLVLLFTVLNSIMTPSLNSNFNMGNSQTNMFGGYNPTMGIEGLLVMLVKVLMSVLVISLILAGFMYVKNLYENGKLNMFSTTSAPTNNTANTDNNGKTTIIVEPENKTNDSKL